MGELFHDPEDQDTSTWKEREALEEKGVGVSRTEEVGNGM